MNTFRNILLSIVVLSLSACATLSPETKAEEAVWQGANAMDAYSTNRMVNDYHGSESGQWQYISGGHHPNTGQIVLNAAVWGGMHFAVTSWLSDHNAPKWLQRTWQLVTLTGTGITVSHNFSLVHHQSSIRQHDRTTQPVKCIDTACAE